MVSLKSEIKNKVYFKIKYKLWDVVRNAIYRKVCAKIWYKEQGEILDKVRGTIQRELK